MSAAHAAASRPTRRLLLGWSASSLPVAPLLVVGAGLGPDGLAILSESALAVLDPAIPVALAALGVLVGIQVGDRRSSLPHLMPFGAVHALFTAGAVGAGFVAAVRFGAVSTVPAWLLPAVCGVCAASSLTLPGRPLSERRRFTDALVEGEVVVTIVLGALLLSALGDDTPSGAAVLLLRGLGVVFLLALAGWLLVRHTTSVTERRVFVMATLLLVGGAADFLASSALLGGLAAGVMWQRLGGPSRETLQADTLYLQHPFVVLVLLVAGARTELSPLTVGLAATYVSLRAVVRFGGGRLVQRLVPVGSADLHLQFVSPGVFGVAFALNVVRVVGLDDAGASAALSAVALGTALSDLTSRLAASRGTAS